MYSGFVVVLFVFLFWSTSAAPCGTWNFDKTHEIILTHPVEEEIILVTFIVDDGGTAEAAENPVPDVQSDNIPADGLDDRLSGEIVDSAANKELSTIAKTDPLPSNRTQEVPQQTFNTTEEAIEEVGFTTESVKEE